MKRLVAMLACAVVFAAAPAIAQATKTVRGSVTSVAGKSVIVSVAGKDMTFAVDEKTHVVAPGAGTKARGAEAAGKSGPALTDVVKTGQAVQVTYHEDGMHADTIRAIASAPPPPPPAPADKAPAAGKAQSATGVVSAVSGNSLTLKEKAGDVTYSVDNKTSVSGRGMGTAGRKLMEAGGKPTVGDLITAGDTVTVSYHDIGGTKTASVIRVVRKKVGAQ